MFFFITFALILYFDWLLGPKKGKFSKKKIFKNLRLMKLILCIHLPNISLYKLLFCSSQIRTLVAMATLTYNGKSEKFIFLQSHWRH